MRLTGPSRQAPPTDEVEEFGETLSPGERISSSRSEGSVDRAGATTPSPATSGIRNALELAGKVVAPATIVAALLYYFGWVRTRWLLLTFGIDYSIVGLSSQDYVLRSIDAMFGFLIVIALSSAAALQMHMLVLSASTRSQFAGKRLRLGLISLALLLLAVGVFGLMRPLASGGIVEPICLTLAAAILLYVRFLLPQPRNSKPNKTVMPNWYSGCYAASVVLVLVLGLFWATSDYARLAGLAKGRETIAELPDRPQVSIYSNKRLEIDVPGVIETKLADSDSAYRYRYAGLVLLLRSDHKYFLVPSDWAGEKRTTVMLPEDNSLRLDFQPK
jgi:hypothetical protein